MAALLLLAGTARAQEFDIFELSDFVDPRARGAEYLANGRRLSDAGSPFLVSRVALGGVSDYYWRTNPTGADVAVLHNATSYYWGANQLNLKLTHLTMREDDAVVPQNRGTIQYARYTARPDPSAKALEAPPTVIVSRYLVGVSVEESPDAVENLEGHRALNYEVAAEVDLRLPFTEIFGTFSYVKRFAGAGESTSRFAYVYHTDDLAYRRARFDMTLAVGAEKTHSWRWGDVRPTLHVRVPLDKVGTVVHAAYAPTVSFESGVEARHEIALFLDRAVFARVFTRSAGRR